MRTPSELNKALLDIRSEAIDGIYSLVKGNSYVFKRNVCVTYEDDCGSFGTKITSVQKLNDVIFFVEEGADEGDLIGFENLPTGDIISIYEALNFEMSHPD